jgi:hypothetical protein
MTIETNISQTAGNVTEAETIERINDAIETLAAEIASFSQMMFYFASQTDDSHKQGMFFTFGNGASSAYERLQTLCERLAPFERLTVNHSLDQIMTTIRGEQP